MGTEASDFLCTLLERTFAALRECHEDNVDYHRFPALRHATNTGPDAATLAAGLTPILTRAYDLAWLHALLADVASRETLSSILAFRALGNRHVKLARNNVDYWQAVRRTEQELRVRAAVLPVPSHDAVLDEYDLHPAGYPLRLNLHLLNVLNTFLLEQYRYARSTPPIEAEPGDVVIDGGGCWGDSALYFAHRVGAAGRVLCCEFVPANLAVLERNLALNPQLRSVVQIVPRALWNVSNVSLDYAERGPGSSLLRCPEKNALTTTITIDQLVEREKRVDFIKLDVEGAELRALQGAAQTLRRFRPQLAVALYHDLDDFVTIPRYLHDLDLGYEFYLDHFTIHQEETILFARSATRGCRSR
jgi:FkbM family methyltransferase